MLIKQWMELIEYRITEGSNYQWSCYGDHAYCLDSWDGEQDGCTFSIVFDTRDQTVYEMNAYDYQRNRAYRWINPDYRIALTSEALVRGVDYKEAWEDVAYVDLEVVDDYFEKAQAIIDDEEYDTRVQVPLTLDKNELHQLMTMAHERDITLNQMVEIVLQAAIDQAKESSD